MTPTIAEQSPVAASPSPQDSNGQLSVSPHGKTPSTKLLLSLLILVTALPYLPALGFGFVYDDVAEVVTAVTAQSTESPAKFYFTSVWDFRHSAVMMNSRYYRPVFRTMQRIDATFFGYNAMGWHLTTLGAHLAATVLIFFLLRRHFPDPWTAFAGAAVFGVHPVHLESVAWITGIPDPLATLFLLGSFLLWLKKLETRRVDLQFYTLVCFAAALLTKEISIVLPAIIFLYVLMGQCGNIHVLENEKNRFRAAVVEALPFGGVAAAFLGVRAVALPPLNNASLPWVPHREAVLTIPSALVFYLRHLIWPAGLTVFPDVRLVSSVKAPGFWVPVIILTSAAACAWAVWRGKRKDGIALAALAWFALPILPVLDLALFFKDDFVHDRYLYLPSVGLAICCAAAARRLFGENPAAARRWIGLAAITVIVSALAVSTAAQSFAWQNNVTLYSRAAQLSSNPVPRIYLAAEYMNSGHLPEAREILERVVREVPESWTANYNLGLADYQLKDMPSAEIYLRRAIALDPGEPDEYLNLGLALLAEKRLNDAEAQLRSALARNPNGEEYHYVLGMIFMAQGKIEAGKDELRKELRNPSINAAIRTQIEQMLGNAPARSAPSPDSPASKN
jgi:Flp pilus assembly protein TadD